MKIWLSLHGLALDVLPELAAGLDELGVEGVAVSDHVCVPVDVTTPYPYTGRAAQMPPETEFPDPIALLAALGARTSRLRLMTHVLVAALRHPVVLAKQVATLSAMTGGRLDLGVGAGWLREEFDAVGVVFARRGAVTDESLAVMRRLWTGVPVNYDGEEFQFATVASRPVPSGPMPVLGGGYSPRALRRAAQLDGWVGVTPALDELAAVLERVRAARREFGDAERAFTIRTGVKGTLSDRVLADVAELGVDGLVVTPHQLGLTGRPPADVTAVAISALRPLVERSATLPAAV